MLARLAPVDLDEEAPVWGEAWAWDEDRPGAWRVAGHPVVSWVGVPRPLVVVVQWDLVAAGGLVAQEEVRDLLGPVEEFLEGVALLDPWDR